jgi:crossover junction endodeoxyribonuclease RusA
MVSPIEDLTGGFGGGDGLFELTPTMTRALAKGRRAAPDVPPGPLPEGMVRLDLPRWDTAWEIKQNRKGWPVVNPKTGKVVKHRPVWDTLRANSRPHWSARHKRTKEVIDAVTRIATAAGLRPCSFLDVALVWAPGSNVNADEDNLFPLLKVCCDALARGPRRDLPGLHLVPDDTSRYMRKVPRIDWPPVPGGLWLEVTVDA